MLRVLGQTSLGLLEEALQDYLRGFAMRELDISRVEDFSPVYDTSRERLAEQVPLLFRTEWLVMV